MEIITKQPKFKPLSTQKRKTLSPLVAAQYYKELRNYYMNLPYDTESAKTKEEKYQKDAKLLHFALGVINKPIVLNKELIPKEDGLIFVSNHICSCDQFPIIYSIGNKPIHFLVKEKLLDMTLNDYVEIGKLGIIKFLKKIRKNSIEKLLNYRVGNFYKKRGAVFIDENNPRSIHAAIEELTKIVLHGGNIFIFPEGTRNKTDKFMLPYSLGAVNIAQITGSPIVPFGIEDNKNLKLKHPIVSVGQPLYVAPGENLIEANQRLFDTCATLLWNIMEIRSGFEFVGDIYT